MLLLAAFGIIAHAAISLASVTSFVPDLQQLGHQTNSIAAASVPIQQLDSALGASVQDLQLMMENTRRDGTRPDLRSLRDVMNRTNRLADSAWARQASAALGSVTPEVRLALTLALTAESRAVVKLVDAVSAYELGWTDQAATSLREATYARSAAMANLREAERSYLADIAERETTVLTAVNRLLRSAMLWGVAGVLVIAVAGTLIYQRVWRPLQRFNHAIDRAIDGDFDVQLSAERRDEFGRLEERFNEMILKLQSRSEEDHKRARNATERLARSMDVSSNEIHIFDAETWRLLYCNRAALENLGYSQEQLEQKAPLDLLPELDENQFSTLLAPLRDGSQSRTTLSTLLRRADGSDYPAELSIQLSHAEDPPVFHAIVLDMSEHTRIEQERDSMFELSPDLLAIGKFDGHLTRVNAAWGRRLGFTEEELLSKPFASFVHPDDAPVARGQILGLREGRAVKGSAIRMRCRDGSYRWISWNIALSDEDGAIYAVGRDITDLRRAQQRQTGLLATISRSAREWKITFDALDTPVLVVDRNGTVTRANEATRKLAGVSHPELLNLPVDALPPAQLWNHAAAMVERAFKEKRTVTAQTPNGRDRRVWDISVSPVLTDDSLPDAATVVAHDVTRVIKLQNSARRNEAMAATGALVAGVAHEVRNPLFSMSATLDAFEARHGTEGSGQQHMQVLRSQLERLRELMRELLEYGKPRQLNLAATGFELVARQAIEEAAHVAQERNVTIVTDFEGKLPLVRADMARLVQVYVNLVANAVQHSPKDSSIVLRAQKVQDGRGAWLETSIKDNGQGFNPDDLQRVFEPFFTRRRGGTGLGLALVQRIVEQHGGVICAWNHEEGGGVVSVRLPVFESGRTRDPRLSERFERR
jgi:PAS domain S-box-containing protein